jgi:D-alanyl-D-alanine carboxypeptidase
MLLLAEEGRLSLDDKAVRWLPELTRANDVTIRHLLSMTSGYPDFWPQDYVMPGMLQNATPQQIANSWAKGPLSFEPGSKWQYSNTNYVIAGMIIERVAGMSVLEFLQRRIFTPLGMTSVTDTDVAALPDSDPMRYTRFGLAPPRPAPKEGRGWMFAAGELAMTAADLAKWNVAMIHRTAMRPASYTELVRETLLTSGAGARYGLGVSVNTVDGRRVVSHGGEVSGFTANNTVYPDDGVAITVLTNLDATAASGDLASRIAKIVFSSSDPATPQSTERARKIFEGLQQGRIDRTLFTSNANAYFSDVALADLASSLKPLGKPQEFTQLRQSLRGGMTARSYEVKFASRKLRVSTFETPDGKLEQYIVAPAE